MSEVEENFKKEVLRITDDYLVQETALKQQIMHLKANQTVVFCEENKRLKIQLEEKLNLLKNNEEAYETKSAECRKYIEVIEKYAEEVNEYQVKIDLIDKRHKNCTESAKQKHRNELMQLAEEKKEQAIKIKTLAKTIDDFANAGPDE